MSSDEYIIWRTSVFERDDYTCQECGQRGGTKHPHHILPWCDYPEPEYSLNVDNGITLCPDCHYKTFKKEYNFISKYLGIIFDLKGIEIFGGNISNDKETTVLINQQLYKQNKLSYYYLGINIWQQE